MSASPSLRSECTLSRHGRRGVWRPISAHAAIVQAALHSNAPPELPLGAVPHFLFMYLLSHQPIAGL